MNLRRAHPGATRSAEPDPRWWSRVGSALLWFALPALAISIVLTYVVLAVVWHANPPVVPVTGRSMQPTLHAGDLVFIRGVQPQQLKKGDIIAFKTTKAMQQKYDVPPEYVHRVIKVSKTSTGYQFGTKGDNVAGPDPFTTFDRDVIGIYAGKLTGAGYPILFFRSRQGLIFAAAVVIVLLLYFVFGFWERRQEALESNALTMEQIVGEARALRDSMLTATGGARAPPAPAGEQEPQEPPGPRMVEVVDEPPEGAVLCSQGCHILLPGARFDPHTGEPVDVPEPPAPQPSAVAFTPIPSSRALVPYVAPGVDFEKLESEIHEAVRSTLDVHETMQELVGAIGEYGEHLRSHTAVIQNLAAVTGELKETTSEMRTFLASLTALLERLVDQSQPKP